MICTVHQPTFLPYLGIIAKIDEADALVLLDDVTYSKSGFTQRNKILTARGSEWVTVSLKKASSQSLIKDLEISKDKRYKKIWNRIATEYRKAPYYDEVMPLLDVEADGLAELNEKLLRNLLTYLGIDTPIVRSSDLAVSTTDPTERNIELTKAMGGTTYLSGKNGRDYMDMTKVQDVAVQFQEYTCKEYPQFNSETFVPYMSVLDYVMNMGSDKSLI